MLKAEQLQNYIKERFPNAAPILLEALILLVAAAFFALSVTSASLAIRSAIRGEDAAVPKDVDSAKAEAEPSSISAASGAIWFSQPDGTFLTGEDVLPKASGPVNTPAPPAAADTPAPAEEPPDEQETPVDETTPNSGISTGRTAPGAQDWTVLVWITTDGREYHSRDDCGSIGSGDARQIQIQEAVALGYQRCGACW